MDITMTFHRKKRAVISSVEQQQPSPTLIRADGVEGVAQGEARVGCCGLADRVLVPV